MKSPYPSHEVAAAEKRGHFPARDAPLTGRLRGYTTSRDGFTLMEILAAMTILMVIVLLLGNVFTDSAKIWKLGIKRAYGLGEGRAVMEYLTRMLSQTVADDLVSFRLRSSVNDAFRGYGVQQVYGWEVDEIYFMTCMRTPSASDQFRRAAYPYIYFVSNMVDSDNAPIDNRFRLVQCRKTGQRYGSRQNLDESAYFSTDWWKYFKPRVLWAAGFQEMETLAENVAAFEVWAWSEEKGRYKDGYYSVDEGGKLPLWVDLWLEMLSEEESIQMAALMAADPNAALTYRNKHVRRYAARVYMPNRTGYSR